MVINEASPNTGDRVDRLDEPAFLIADHGEFLATGLTKREWFAAMAMQGYLAGDAASNLGYKACAEYSARQADELIRILQLSRDELDQL
ncbi:MAG: hypothetical protein AAF329_24855 [Cyanobacteria bacterium P01_A01_bin.17]